MQPSQLAIEREFEALRDIRRRSTTQGGPGTLLLDPDLPAQPPTTAPPLSPQAWASAAVSDSKTSPTKSREDDSGSSSESATTLADDPFHLFWVPAHLHPELAPSEFRAFLKEHARGPPDGLVSLSRSSSASSSTSTGLGRRRSMLSRPYKPQANDGVEEEHVVPIQRKNSIYSNEGPQLTISDLQKLEELAEEASKSNDPTKLRKAIRRSLSLNVAPSSVLDQMDDVPDPVDDADAPIIVPKPNQILRRAARTKIRKPGLAGDGGGHRFTSTRRRASARAATIDVPSPTNAISHDHHAETERPSLPAQSVESVDEDFVDNRRITYSEEAFIYDSYATEPEETETSPPASVSSPPPSAPTQPSQVDLSPPSHPPAPITPSIISPTPDSSLLQQEPLTQLYGQPLLPSQISPPLQSGSVLHQPQPQRHLSPVLQQAPAQPARTPSPDASSVTFDDVRSESRNSDASSLSASTDKRKDKDKRFKLGKWGSGDKSSKKSSKEKDRDKDREGKEKEGGFFGSLFGGKKKQEESQNPANGNGSATAASLLGPSKAKQPYQPSLSPQLGNPYARYPIHVERAVYRLSHIKLANPRRPLYEQVLISNLMFWYLGVINKTQQGPGQGQAGQQQQPQQVQVQQNTTLNAQAPAADGLPPANGNHQEKERLEREQQEREEREQERAAAAAAVTEKERLERQREQEKIEQTQTPPTPPQQRTGRRGSLTKQNASGSGRRAETPVRGPQYGLQHQEIEQEYGGSPMMRTSSAPSNSTSQQGGYSSGYSSRSYQKSPPQSIYQQAEGNTNFYFGRSGGNGNIDGPSSSTDGGGSSASNASLPPGAMPPVSTTSEKAWYGSSALPISLSSPPSSPPKQSVLPSPPKSSPLDGHPVARHRSAKSPPLPSSNHVDEWGRPGHYDDWDKTVGKNGNGSNNGPTKGPSRSLSANAAPATQNGYANHNHNGNVNGSSGSLKKKISANAAVPERVSEYHRKPRTSESRSEEEDVPLAVWQQSRRK